MIYIVVIKSSQGPSVFCAVSLKKNLSSSTVSEKKTNARIEMDPIGRNSKSLKLEFRNHSKKVLSFSH